MTGVFRHQPQLHRQYDALPPELLTGADWPCGDSDFVSASDALLASKGQDTDLEDTSLISDGAESTIRPSIRPWSADFSSDFGPISDGTDNPWPANIERSHPRRLHQAGAVFRRFY